MSQTPPDRRARITTSFGRADGYEQAAGAQAHAAEQLASLIAGQPQVAEPRVLELGCGTGLLTRALSRATGPARWTVSDIAPEMVARARAATGLDADWRVIDGEHVDPALGPFDLIASGMAFQWFADLPAALARLGDRLAPGGLLAFSTMAAGSFAGWNAALAAEGLSSGTPAYPDERALLAMAPPGFAATVEIVDIAQPEADARGFLRRVKAIGAGIPAAGHRPLPPAALKRAMARFDQGPRTADYRIALCLFRRG